MTVTGKLRTWGRAFRDWGEASFTVMMIPHSEKRILSFQISHFVLIYLAGILLLAGASYFLFRQVREGLQNQLAEIRVLDREYREDESRIAQSLSRQVSHLRTVHGELVKIHQILGSQAPAFGRFEEKRRASAQIQHAYGILPRQQSENLQGLKTLQNRLEASGTALDSVSKVLSARSRVVRDIPSGFPLYASGWNKTSSFGVRYSPFEGDRRFHTGVDLAAFPGVPILAAADGVVLQSGFEGGYGNTVRIQHKYGWISVYAHNQRVLAYAGQVVKRGDRIALLGQSGRATGPHLHYEIRVEGNAVDPWPYLVAEF